MQITYFKLRVSRWFPYYVIITWLELVVYIPHILIGLVQGHNYPLDKQKWGVFGKISNLGLAVLTLLQLKQYSKASV